MIYITRIKIKNFKSFKIVDIPVPRTFICFAGPNGSGKSNVVDSVRFCLGETSLKSLRAKRAKDLIHHNSSAAEVTLTLDGHAKYEIKRAIREDGKILYKLNGKKTTRSAIMDLLKQYNLDESGRNIIAQGEVQRIINMSGKERRTIIDSVAGVSNFEEKKKEAVRELDVVETRIKDANLVMGERIAFLKELEKEKEVALTYIENKKILTNAKATLLKTEIQRIEKELNDLYDLDKKVIFNLSNKQKDLDEVEDSILNLDKKRLELSKLLQQKQQTASLIRKIEELKATVTSKNQIINDKEEYFRKIETEENAFKKELKNEIEELTKLEEDIESLRKELKIAENEVSKYGQQKSSSEVEQLKSSIRELEAKIHSTREKLLLTEADITAKLNVIEIKTNELDSIKVSNDIKEEEVFFSEKEALKKDIGSVEKEIENCFKRTKDINNDIANMDKKLLEFKEKASLLRVKVNPTLANPALKFINQIKEKGEKGIYGIVVDLIKFENKYSTAIETAAGNRLLYVVVEDASTASKIIELLKKANAGRATFIPIKEIKTNYIKSQNGFEPLINFVDYSDMIQKAAEFIFGDTLLINNSNDAKKVGIGNARMVTLEGEIFERSGLISGGKNENNILATMQLKKIDNELEEIKSTKDSLIKELFVIREEESGMRANKSELEIRVKTIELTLKQNEIIKKDQENLLIRKNEINDFIENKKSEIKEKQKERDSISKDIDILTNRILELTKNLSKAEVKEKESTDTEQAKRTEMAAHLSSARATYEGKMKELELRKQDIHKMEDKIKQIEKEKKDISSKLIELKRQLVNDSKDLEKSEQEVIHYSKEIEKLFENIKKYEEELQLLGKKRGEKRIEIDKLVKDQNQFSIKKATFETRLQDLKGEFSNYKAFDELKLEKEEIISLIKKTEENINSLGNVNMAAIELYDKKYAEIGEIKERIEKLSEERTAVLNMMGEIEERKKESFFETFYAVSDNFKKMFQHITIGEGFIYLDKPNEPFESGLFIKLKRNGKEHTLDALSGGENSLVALMFIFALQFFKPAPFYMLDEVDAALDKENSKNLSKLVAGMSKDTQFLVVSHNDTVMSTADTVIGVTKIEGISKLVGVKLETMNA